MNTQQPSVWDALIRHRPKATAVLQDAPETKEKSKAAKVRDLLAKGGRLNAASICMEVEIASTSFVGALLKWDIKLGRVLCEDGMYWMNPEFVEEESTQIRASIRLLRKHGYKVTGPKP